MTESDFAADGIAPLPAEAETSALPWSKVIPIYIALWCEAFNSSSIFAYVGYMVLDFGLSKDEKDSAFMHVVSILHLQNTDATLSSHLPSITASLLRDLQPQHVSSIFTSKKLTRRC